MIGQQTALGGMLMVATRLITRLLDLATVLVLARLLQPTDFGLVAIGTSIVVIVETALELPLNQALVRLSLISDSQYDTAFTLSALRSVLLTVCLVAVALPFAHIYGDARLVSLVYILCLGALARGLTSPRLAEYQKNMSFWRDFVIEFVGKTTGFSVAVLTAMLTASYWSIAAGSVAYPCTMMIASYVLAPYRPRFSLSALPLFSGFLGWMSAAQVIGALNWQTERLLLGKLKATSQLGLFTTASDVSQIPLAALFGPIMRPLLAAFSMLRHDQARLARSYQTAASAVVTAGLPILIGEALLAEPFVRLVLGDKWLDAVPLLRWLALSLIPGLFATPMGALVLSFGETHIFLQRNLIEFSIKLPLLIVGGVQFGFAGVIVARLISETCTALYCIIMVRRLVGLSIKEQMFAPWRSIVSALIMAVPVALLAGQIQLGIGSFENAVSLMLISLCGGGVYFATLCGLWKLAGSPIGIESMAIAGLTKLSRMLVRSQRKQA